MKFWTEDIEAQADRWTIQTSKLIMKKKQAWRIGDIFAVRLNDGKFSAGQVVGVEPDMPKSATIALFDKSVEFVDDDPICPELQDCTVYSSVFATVDHLHSGAWLCVCNETIQTEIRPKDYYAHQANGWIGARVVGSAIISEFVNAYYGLAPWDNWHDPHFLDSLLLSEDLKLSARLVYKS